MEGTANGLAPGAEVPRPAVPVIESALKSRRVVWLDYEDRHEEVSRRAVEPVALVEAEGHWYLLAWCRVRDDARCFRLDRIRRAIATDETAAVRDLDEVSAQIPDVVLRVPSFA
jgi:predicted DNA-binding transcriptional regulator YafY